MVRLITCLPANLVHQLRHKTPEGKQSRVAVISSRANRFLSALLPQSDRRRKVGNLKRGKE